MTGDEMVVLKEKHRLGPGSILSLFTKHSLITKKTYRVMTLAEPTQ